MKDRTLQSRVMPIMYIIGFFITWYALARVFVLQHTLNRYALCHTFSYSPTIDNCPGVSKSLPTYFSLHSDTIDVWVITLASTGLLLIAGIAFCFIIAFLQRNGQNGRPFYGVLHVSVQTNERHWFGRRKRRHMIYVMRD